MYGYFKLIYYYTAAILKELFSIKSSDPVLYDALITNFGYKTYRFSMHAPQDMLISLRIFKMIIKASFIKSKIRSNAKKNW